MCTKFLTHMFVHQRTQAASFKDTIQHHDQDAWIVKLSTQSQSVIQDSIDSLIDDVNAQAFTRGSDRGLPVGTHTPAISASMAAPTFRKIAILLIVTHLFPCRPRCSQCRTRFCKSLRNFHPRSPASRSMLLSHLICRRLFSSILVRLYWPNGLLPDYVLCGRASRNCQCSR